MSRYLAAGLLLLIAAWLCGCQKKTDPIQPAETTAPAQTTSLETLPSSVSEEGQLIALAETQEEAQQIAKLYHIELVDFSFGVALFHTEEDPREVIQRGIDNHWPELALNHSGKAF